MSPNSLNISSANISSVLARINLFSLLATDASSGITALLRPGSVGAASFSEPSGYSGQLLTLASIDSFPAQRIDSMLTSVLSALRDSIPPELLQLIYRPDATRPVNSVSDSGRRTLSEINLNSEPAAQIAFETTEIKNAFPITQSAFSAADLGNRSGTLGSLNIFNPEQRMQSFAFRDGIRDQALVPAPTRRPSGLLWEPLRRPYEKAKSATEPTRSSLTKYAKFISSAVTAFFKRMRGK